MNRSNMEPRLIFRGRRDFNEMENGKEFTYSKYFCRFDLFRI